MSKPHYGGSLNKDGIPPPPKDRTTIGKERRQDDYLAKLEVGVETRDTVIDTRTFARWMKDPVFRRKRRKALALCAASGSGEMRDKAREILNVMAQRALHPTEGDTMSVRDLNIVKDALLTFPDLGVLNFSGIDEGRFEDVG